MHEDEGPRLVASLADKRVLILRNHGMLVCGSDVFNAFRWMWTLQRACEVQVAADSLRGANIALADPVRRACAADAAAFEPRESARADAVHERAAPRRVTPHSLAAWSPAVAWRAPLPVARRALDRVSTHGVGD